MLTSKDAGNQKENRLQFLLVAKYDVLTYLDRVQ